MQRYDVHLCLVSDQPLPNLIPVLDPRWRPRQVILLVTPAMERKGRHLHLKSALESAGCQVRVQTFNAFAIEEIRRGIIESLSGISGRSIALNLTGGTKIMALGAYEVFRELGLPAFYVDTGNGHLIEIFPEAKTLPLPDVVKINHYLNAYGYSINKCGGYQVPPALQGLTDTLVKNAKRYEKALGTLNFCASDADKTLVRNLGTQEINNQRFRELLTLFAEAGVLALRGQQLVFADEQARFFANGGWLESHVLKVLNGFKGKEIIRDHAGSLELISSANNKNELDLAFTARNRLHLIECKTGRMKGSEQNPGDITYKLETLADLVGGVFGKAMLVSYRPLRQADRTRCAEFDIQVVEGGDIAQLPDRIGAWIAS